MGTDPTSHPAIDRLVGDLVDGAGDDPLGRELQAWLLASHRFRSFVEAHRDKIRKKLRTAADPEARRDVRAELRVAALLLADRHLTLAFEAYGVGRGGPDFTVTFRGERAFNVEVTRLRRELNEATFTRALLGKLRQLPPSAPNLLVLATDAGTSLDLAQAVRALRSRADAGDEALLQAAGVSGVRAFYDRFLRLGGVIAWAEAASDEPRATLWLNGSARIPLPSRAANACLALLGAAGIDPE